MLCTLFFHLTIFFSERLNKMCSTPFNISEIIKRFHIPGEYIGFSPLHYGHINNTYVLQFKENNTKDKYHLLQQINVNVFKDPEKLMQNIVSVTKFLKDKIIQLGGNPDRETLNVYPTDDGKNFYKDDLGRYWRCYNYVNNAYTCDTVDSPEVFFHVGVAFGKFQCMLSDFPIDTLYDTIPDFHNTLKRFYNFKKAVENDFADRLKNVPEEVSFAFARQEYASILPKLVEKKLIPIRVTHNDTKLNNVMFDNDTSRGICVVDLDTVMPGLSLYDFGDSIRFGANTAAEDEKDLSKVSIDLELYENFVNGYLSEAGKSLTSTEIEYLPFSAKLMTYECGMRFLTDYLNGDTYFKINYPDHNLDRCHTQFELLKDMEKNYDKMIRITKNAYLNC